MSRYKTQRAAPSRDALLAHLRATPSTIPDAAIATGLSTATLGRVMADFRKMARHPLFITRWERNERDTPIAVWAIKTAHQQVNAKKPPLKPVSEIKHESYLRHRMESRVKEQARHGRTPRTPVWLRGLAP